MKKGKHSKGKTVIQVDVDVSDEVTTAFETGIVFGQLIDTQLELRQARDEVTRLKGKTREQAKKHVALDLRNGRLQHALTQATRDLEATATDLEATTRLWLNGIFGSNATNAATPDIQVFPLPEQLVRELSDEQIVAVLEYVESVGAVSIDRVRQILS